MGRRGWHQWREPDPSDNNKHHEEPPEGVLRHENHLTGSLFKSRPFSVMVQNRKHGQSEDKWRKFYGPLGNGAQVNTIMLRYVRDHSLQVGPITNLMGSKVAHMGLGNAYTRLLGYVVIQVQADRVQGYDEDQIALLIPDLSNFVAQIPVILGTSTIGWVVNVMKEAEVDALAMLWANARVVHLLSVHRMMPMEVGDGQKEEVDVNGYDQLMYTQNVETIEPFSSCIIPVKAGKPTWENAIMSWYKPYKLRMVPCHRASLCRTHILSWGKAVRK